MLGIHIRKHNDLQTKLMRTSKGTSLGCGKPESSVPTTSTRGTRKNALPLITLSDALNTVPTHRLDTSPPEM